MSQNDQTPKGSLNNMKLPESRFCKETRVVKTSRVFPLDTNNHNTLFGGKLMSYIDDIASISAARHCRCETVTASMDSVDFLRPIGQQDSVCLESYYISPKRSTSDVMSKTVSCLSHLVTVSPGTMPIFSATRTEAAFSGSISAAMRPYCCI